MGNIKVEVNYTVAVMIIKSVRSALLNLLKWIDTLEETLDHAKIIEPKEEGGQPCSESQLIS